MAGDNLTSTTRELFLRTVVAEVLMRIGLCNRMMRSRRVAWRGGLDIRRPVDMAEMDSLAQSYFPNEPLTVGSKTLLKKPHFHWKYNQLPITYDVQDEIENDGGPETQVVDFTKFLVKKAHRGCRLKLNSMMYAPNAGTSDTDRDFQSIPDALTHDAAYGSLTRATTVTNKWWQGASIDDSFTGQTTAVAASIANFRRIKSKVWKYVESPGSLLAVMCSTVFQTLQAEAESRHIYTRDGSDLAKQGFNAMMIDGVEFLEEPYLESATSSMNQWFFLMHLPDWELRIHPRRAFKTTGFVWQGDQPNGLDSWLARVMLAGNLVCWKPNGSAFLYMS